MKKTTTYRKPMNGNLFEDELAIEALSRTGNPPGQLSAPVDFEMFRPALEDVPVRKDCKSQAGCPLMDAVLMFKVIFLQRYYGPGDHRTRYQVMDRAGFRRFLGTNTVAEVPDEKTLRACRDKLSRDGTFDSFRSFLDEKGLSFNEGKIIDASGQRSTREENRQTKNGHHRIHVKPKSAIRKISFPFV